MSRPTVVLDLAGDHQIARDLAAGGVFVPGCTLALLADCDLVVRAGDGAELVLEARVVFADAAGAGLELVDGSAETRQRIAAMAAPPAEDEQPEQIIERKIALNLHERLRGLTL